MYLRDDKSHQQRVADASDVKSWCDILMVLKIVFDQELLEYCRGQIISHCGVLAWNS